MLIFGYLRYYNTPGHADTLLYRANARYSICLHGLVWYRTNGIENKHSMLIAHLHVYSNIYSHNC